MAYLPKAGQAILFGGLANSALLGDTWTLQGGCWALDHGATSPSARTEMAMTYSPSQGVIVAFGGRTGLMSATFSNETWFWDGQAWKLAATNGPSLAFAWAAFDSTLNQVLLYGTGSDGLGQTWTWDGAKWQRISATSPPARTSAVMAFDPSSHRVLLFGGLDLQSMTLLNDTWAWNGSAWSRLSPAHSPTPRVGAAMASFTAQNRVLLVGGIGKGKIINEAWLWDGSDWMQTSSPGPTSHAVAADTGLAVLVFGGENDTSTTGDLKVWDGSKWAAN